MRNPTIFILGNKSCYLHRTPKTQTHLEQKDICCFSCIENAQGHTLTWDIKLLKDGGGTGEKVS